MTTSDRGQRPGLFISGLTMDHKYRDYSSLIIAGHAGPEHLPRGPREGRGGRGRDATEKNE